ncbi:hypothetical protein BH20ACT4_BH20ACT4_06400 [soil metagenome]
MKPHRIFAVLAVVTPSLMACGSGFDPDSSGAATTQATEGSLEEPDTDEPTRSTEIGLPPDLTFPEPEDTWPTDPGSPPIISADPSTPAGPTDPTTTVTQPPDTEWSLPAPPSSGKGDVYPARLFESLTDSGQQQASGIDWRARPAYAVGAEIDPDSGRIQGGLNAMVPIGSDTDQVVMRWFPNAVADDATIEQVTVNGEPAEFEVDESVVTIDAGGEHPDEIVVTMEFGYTVPDFKPQAPTGMPTGDALDPTEIGLLANSDGTMMLGHWFPVWIPEGFDADPVLDGYGDIANYPAGGIVAGLQVPDGSIVRTSGERLEGEDGDGRLLEGGMGLRDLAVVVMDDPEQATTDVNGVQVSVMAPAGTADVDVVLEQSARSVKVLSDAFGPYPWVELDVIAAPLGAGVGGMEWPGMIWIESTIFEGGIPGMGDLGDLGDLGELEDVLGDIDLMIGTIREWTIAHEAGHMWWHSLIGNDSIVAPVVDEPLAQHSACLVLRQTHPEGEQVCDIHTLSMYSQLRSLLGVEDTPANQPSDEFDSSTQYGAVVYGKAPGLYRELEATFGVDQVTAALAALVDQHAFGQISGDDLRTALGEQLGDPAAFDEPWRRWLEEVNGDEDIPG